MFFFHLQSDFETWSINQNAFQGDTTKTVEMLCEEAATASNWSFTNVFVKQAHKHVSSKNNAFFRPYGHIEVTVSYLDNKS